MHKIAGRRGTLVLLLSAAHFAAAVPARAAIESVDATGWLQMEAGGAGQAITSGDFSIFTWIRPSAIPGPSALANVFEIQNGLILQLNGSPSAGARVTLLRSGGSPATITASAPIALQPNEWALLVVSHRQSQGELRIWAISQSQPLASGIAPLTPGFTPGPVGNNTIIGWWSSEPMIGRWGLIAVRNHAINQIDVLDVWSSRVHHAPYGMNNISGGGGRSMTGAAGCIWMVNHSMVTRPINLGAFNSPDGPPGHAAVVGQPVTIHNYQIYDTTHPSLPTSWLALRRVWNTESFTFVSPYDDSNFFIRELPQLSKPLPFGGVASGISPKAHRLAIGPQPGEGLLRIMSSANSRGVEGGDYSFTGGGSYAAGFIGINLNKTAGILNRPLRLAELNEPWFGFNTSMDGPHITGTVTEITLTDFSRFWTNANHGGSTGGGSGVLLAPGASFTLRCKPQGMIEATQPLIVQAYALRFPGASSLTWMPNKHTQQGQTGIDTASPVTVPLDTTTFTRTFNTAAGDAVQNAFAIFLGGNHTANVAPGMACVVNGAISLVNHVSYNPTTNATLIAFEHGLSSTPVNGSVVRFGSWGFETTQYTWPALSAGDPSIWRGLKLSAGAGQGTVVFAFSAWRPSVDGFIFGTAGWAGRGYAWQMQQAFDAAMQQWMQLLAPDVWLQMFAQQNSTPSSMSAYAARIRAALPNSEIVWLGDMQHDSQTFEDWHRYILENAEAEGVVAVSLLMHPQIGSQNDLFGDGLRSDLIHISQRGNERLASLWSNALLTAAIDPDGPCGLADLNCDGVVDVLDLLQLFSAWGQCPQPANCPADLNGDGLVDVLDVLILFSNWG